MRVIEQLVDYFTLWGTLDEEEQRFLEKRGFVVPRCFYEDFEDLDDELGIESEPKPDPLDVVQDVLERRRSPRRGSKRSAQPRVDSRVLATHLQSLFEGWSEMLAGLTPLASSLSPCQDWRQAVSILHHAEKEVLRDRVEQGLRNGSLTLLDLARLIEIEWEIDRSVLTGVGPIVGPYRQVIRGVDFNDFGKMSWILRTPEVLTVWDTVRARGKVLRALADVCRQRPKLVADAMRGPRHPVAFWCLVVLYNADLWKANGRPPSRSYQPREPRWGYAEEACSAARLMDPPLVDRFLDAIRGDLDFKFSCPEGWRG